MVTLQPFSLLLPNRMVSDLAEEHAADWDVYLPAKVFSLCFKEHSKTKERPFSLLCCKALEPVQCPRGLEVSGGSDCLKYEKITVYSKMTLSVSQYTYSKVQESVFVLT